MSSPEIIILVITGVVACVTYLVKHFKKSSCWTKESCCSCKMDKDDSSKSDVVVSENETEKPQIVSSVV